MGRACVRAEARDGTIVLEALNANGEALLGAPIARRSASGGPIACLLALRPAARARMPPNACSAPSRSHALRALLDAAAAPRGEPFGALLLGVAGFDLAAWGETMPDGAAADFPEFVFFVPDTLLT